MFNWLKTKSHKPKTLGQLGEEFAQKEYQKRGYSIIAANFFNRKGLRLGEIDFIARDAKTVIFVEVKTRSQGEGKFGSGAEAVNVFKQLKLLKAVKIFLQKNPKYRNLQPQIDVCIVSMNELDPVRSRPANGTASAALGRLTSNGVDNNSFSATIIPNAVEDWN